MKFLNEIKLIGLHVIIAMAVFAVPLLSNIYLVGIFIYFFFRIIKSTTKERTLEILLACAYIVGAEVFIRMTGGSILYEASKYMIIFFSLVGIVTTRLSQKSFVYVLYIMLLILGIFVSGFNQTTDTVIRKAIAFNLSGPFCLGIVAIFCYQKVITYVSFQKLLFYIALPLISTTVYLFLYNPSVREVISGTGSNFDTSGGFGPNQVATVLGIGMFIFTVRFFSKSPYKFSKIINIILLAVISFRAIVTFSRGGVIVAIFMILAFIVLYFKKSTGKNKKRVVFLTTLFVFLGLSIWTISSLQTNGIIENRYNNEDALGREKEDFSTGRSDLMAFELNAFLENPFFGIGVGKSKELRFEKTGVKAASHNEMSRILSEHGLFGLFAFSILFLTPLILRIRNKSNIFFYSFFLFWFLTINHSSMRIAAPAFIYGLCLLSINYEKPPIHRKQAISKR
ncbi:O-antigen ligase-like membrane protein [Lacinutrix venerupis]|uniref:O-antigen ligase family protein n=1 Tax=Lacinutrix venerupis TaxID=1486034 RepID=UPI000EB439F7|nr:O-antigen ligase family protein [Lacinutrix venerupis]RLJ64362.1 O-antigen ligase-like membrane protein [Lacinutrix venerupis]